MYVNMNFFLKGHATRNVSENVGCQFEVTIVLTNCRMSTEDATFSLQSSVTWRCSGEHSAL